MRFRPSLVPTAFMIFGVALTWSLGVWQLSRHQEKTELKNAILEGLDGRVLDTRDLSGSTEQLYYRKIEVEGHWRLPIALMGARKEFDRPGYGLVQPLELEGGELLLVDRGWVPRDGLAEAMAQIQGQPEQTLLQGQLRPVEGEKGTVATPEQDQFERWPPGSWPALWERLPEPKIDGIVLAGEPMFRGKTKDPTRLPVDGYHPLPRMTDSLSYAFQWWIFGTILIIVWAFLSSRPPPEDQGDSPWADPQSGRGES